MTITLISKEQLDRLFEIQKTYPNLTYDNKGYDSIRISDLTPEEIEHFKEAENILKESIKGFRMFNHFKPSKTQPDRLKIRFQYNWRADEEPQTGYFTGVGYLFIDELYKGFDSQTDIVVTKNSEF